MPQENLSQSGYTLLSLAQLGEILGISRIAVYKKVKKGQIPAKRVGRGYAVSVDLIKSKKPDFVSTDVEPTEKDYISIPQLATILGLSRVAVHNRVRDGQVKARRVGRSFAIPLTEVERLKTGLPQEPAQSAQERDVGRLVKDICTQYKNVLRKLDDDQRT